MHFSSAKLPLLYLYLILLPQPRHFCLNEIDNPVCTWIIKSLILFRKKRASITFLNPMTTRSTISKSKRLTGCSVGKIVSVIVRLQHLRRGLFRLNKTVYVSDNFKNHNFNRLILEKKHTTKAYNNGECYSDAHIMYVVIAILGSIAARLPAT